MPAGCQTHTGLPRLPHGLVGLGQGGFQGTFALAKRAFCVGQAALAEAGRVHGAGAIGQIVCLVDQEQPVAGGVEETLQVHHRVKQIVVVPDHNIAPFAQVQPQLKGAYGELSGGVGQCGTAELAAAVQQCGQRIFDAVVVAVCIGAHLRQADRMALGVRVQAGFFLGGQGHTAQGKVGLYGLQAGNGILGGGLCGVAGGEVKQLLSAAAPHGFQGREERTHGLADAGGGLTEQPCAFFGGGGGAGPPDLARQCPLPGAVGFKREPHGGQAAVAGFLPCKLTLCPGQIPVQEFVQELLQLLPGKVPYKAEDPVGVDLIIGQPHIHGGQAFLCAVDGSVHHALRPVAGVHVLADLFLGHRGGLDLVNGHNAGFVGKNAVGPALQRKADVVDRIIGAEGYLGGVTLPGGLLQPAVDAGTFQCAVKTGKPAVDAAAAQQKLHQLPDGQTDVGHDFTSLIIKNSAVR